MTDLTFSSNSYLFSGGYVIIHVNINKHRDDTQGVHLGTHTSTAFKQATATSTHEWISLPNQFCLSEIQSVQNKHTGPKSQQTPRRNLVG